MMKSSSIVAAQEDGAGPLSDLQRTVLAEAERSQSVTGYRWLQVVGPLVAMANLPLGAVLMVGGAACEALAEHKDLRNAQMPDEWLGQVASQQGISQEGLAFLARRLSEAGHVSVQDAVDWLGVEEKAAQRSKRAAIAHLPGAQQLLERARSECGSLLDPSIVERATTLLRTAARQTPNVLAALRGLTSRTPQGGSPEPAARQQP